ncbi:MAG: ATP-binding protein, partial [Rhodoferax sp.]
PARFQLIAAMNPCPCGYQGSTAQACRCTPDQIHRYQSKLSGPLMDRIDLHVEVPNLPHNDLLGAPAGESTDSIRERCEAARQRAVDRQGCSNMALQGQGIDLHVMLDADALNFLNLAAGRLGWSARGTHRALKVARTIADLAGVQHTQVAHVAEAMQYRRRVASSI